MQPVLGVRVEKTYEFHARNCGLLIGYGNFFVLTAVSLSLSLAVANFRGGRHRSRGHQMVGWFGERKIRAKFVSSRALN